MPYHSDLEHTGVSRHWLDQLETSIDRKRSVIGLASTG